MKIFIIGAKGMLGQELARAFQNGHELLLWDREELDITDQKAVSERLTEVKPELVINSAAFTDVDGAESSSELANKINGYAVGYLAAAAKKLDVPMVHFSTEYVFEGENQDGYREDDKPNPQSAYGKSKLLGEQELQKNTDKFYLIRLSRLFGKSGSGKKSFVQLMLDLSKNKKELDVVDEELSCPTYAVDLAAATREIVEKKMPFGIYHRNNPGAVTWLGFASEIFKIKRIDVKLNPVPASRFSRPAKRPKYGVLLNTKLPAMRPWQEALKEFLQ